jgi:radical SAM protein with 4Fe4S-binding SPASM domain
MNRPPIYDSPFAVYLEVTNTCNLQCRHCYMSDSSDTKKEPLRVDEILSVIDQLDIMNVIDVILTGGEPLLREHIFDIVKYCSQKGIRSSLTTNGIEIDEAVVIGLKESGINTVTVSIEGITGSVNDTIRGKGNLKRAIRGLDLLLLYEMNAEVEITLRRSNIEEIPAMIRFFREKGVSRVQINRIVTTGRGIRMQDYTREEYTRIGSLLSEIIKTYGDYVHLNPTLRLCTSITEECHSNMEKTACGAGFSFCGIMWNGDVVPCLLMRDIFLGNVKKTFFSEIWKFSPLLRSFRNAFADPHDTGMVLCCSCSHEASCGRGCRAQAYHTYGSYTHPDPFCEIWK